jgi:hypothetical protein
MLGNAKISQACSDVVWVKKDLQLFGDYCVLYKNIKQNTRGLGFFQTPPVLKVIKLRIETSLKSQASDWLKCQPIAISANQMLEI